MNILDYAIVTTYLAGLLLLGFFLRQHKSKQDYFLGGRTLGWKPLTLSIMATQLSAVSFVSAPAFVGLREGGGLIWLSYELALPLAMLFLMWTILPKLHNTGVVSVYDYLELRFSKSTRLLLSFVFQVSRSFATGIMIYAVSIILQGTLGISLLASIILIGIITVIYSLQGGMKAVVYGDAIQMLLIVFGALICLGYGIHLIGGIESVRCLVEPSRLQAVDFNNWGFDGSSFGFWPMLFGGFVLYASYYGCDQSEAQRSLSASNLQEQRKMLLAASLLRFPITLIYCAAGLVIGAFALATPEFYGQIPADKPDWMMPVFIANYLPNGLIGLLLVAIMAAAMSSLSSAINSLSAVSVEDYFRWRNKSDQGSDYMKLARYAGFFWGTVTLVLSFFAGDIAPTVIEAINKVGSVFYGPVLACFVLGFMDKKVKAIHINFGLVLGVFSNLFLWLVMTNIFWFWWNLSGFMVTILASYLLLALVEGRESTHIKWRTMPIPRRKGDAIALVSWFAAILAICVFLSHFSLGYGGI